MADWNWFYSSLAQSAAALVAFISAAVISRLLYVQAERARLLERRDQLISTAIALTDRLSNRQFAWGIRLECAYIREVIGVQIQRGQEVSMSPSEWISRFSFLRFLPTIDIDRLLTDSQTEWERQREKDETKGLQFGDRDMVGVGTITWTRSKADLEREQDRVDELLAEVRHNLRDLLGIRREMQTYPPGGTRILRHAIRYVGVLFLVGVLYPLACLPASGRMDIPRLDDVLVSAKFIPLIIMASIILIGLGYLIRQINGLPFHLLELAPVITRAKFSAYSSYLAELAKKEE
ncbi:MAG: hypothetical protein IT332_09580 [Ardenticatenales bacterium]|nr:hypothetical protein [Ardenticatenales bacterium]